MHKSLMWCFIVQNSSWVIVHPLLNPLDLSISYFFKRLMFWQEATDNFMLILTRTSFKRSKRMTKVYIGFFCQMG